MNDPLGAMRDLQRFAEEAARPARELMAAIEAATAPQRAATEEAERLARAIREPYERLQRQLSAWPWMKSDEPQ